MRTLIALPLALLCGCTDEVVNPAPDQAVADATTVDLPGDNPEFGHFDLTSIDLDYMAHWTGDCCGLTCKPGQLCVHSNDGVIGQCGPLTDGGACAPGTCSLPTGFCGMNMMGCDSGHHGYCIDFPQQCVANPTCGCLVPFTETDQSGNCHQNCFDDQVVPAGVLRCQGL